MFEAIAQEYKKSIKSFDTEENIDLCFFRPVGFAWACLFRKCHITPNMVTIASIFLGMAGGACFYPNNIYINIVGILLLVWAGMYDCADGMLARLTGQKSELGRFLDGIAGDFWFLAIYLAIIFRSNHFISFFHEHLWIMWAGVAAAAISHTTQSAIADRYRQLHLLIVNGYGGSELDFSAPLWERCHKLSWKKNFLKKLYLYLYAHYTELQEKLSPKMENLYKVLAQRYPNFDVPTELRDKFRKMSFKYCKWENFMTYNWRAIFLYITVLAGYPWIYLCIEITVFNIVLLLVVHFHERTCEKMLKIIETQD